MKSVVSLLTIIVALSGIAFAQKATTSQQTHKVKSIKLPPNSTTGEVTGNIKDGQKLSSLRWAEKSNVACFPGTRFEMFTGNHVFYRITLPRASAMKVVVIPADGKAINLYALRQSMRRQAVPPNIVRAISCEASYPLYANLGGGRTVRNKDDGTRKVEYISVNSPYSILIGVAGAKGLTEGAFKMQIEIKPR